jgi:hypothetical protein
VASTAPAGPLVTHRKARLAQTLLEGGSAVLAPDGQHTVVAQRGSRPHERDDTVLRVLA